jgi:hypothetical protein
MSTEEEAAAKAAAEAAAKPLTMADLSAMLGGKDLSTVVHAAASAHVKRAEEKAAKELKARDDLWSQRLEEERANFGKTLDERIAALKPAELEKPAKGAKPDEPKAFKLEDHEEWRKAQEKAKETQAELTKLRGENDLARKREAEAVAKSRAQNLTSSVKEALTKAGIPADRHKAAIAVLREDGLFNYAENGEGDAPVFRGADGEVALDDGIKSWSKTPEAKIFMPPLNPGGSGGGPGHSSGNRASNTAEGIVGSALQAHMRGNLG